MRPDPGWVAVFRAAGTDPPEGGVPVPGELSLRFAPGGNGDTTLVMVLDLPRDGFRVVPGDDDPRREIVVDGEILRGKDLHDHFRYRFEIPGAEAPERLVLPVERPLAPGPYRLRLRARDAGGPGYYRDQRDVLVPAATGHAATTEPAPGRTTIRIQPLPEELLTGTVRILAEASGERIDRVRFDLDGREVLSKGRPPYAVEIDLGQKPRRRTVRVTALDAAGREVASDEVALNVGPHRFTIRLIDPRPGSGSASPLRATAVVEVPRGEQLERVELFLDDTRLATLYQPPYTLLLPAASTGGPLSHVRVVAHLVGGASAEDLVFLDAPEGLDAVDIQMIELYTTVLDRRGRPVPGLERRDFRVLEDGREQEVLRFLPSPEVPLHAGILLDTSTSMAERIDEAEAAALGFFYQILEDRDRAAVITFDESPRLRVPFTNRKDVLAGGLADLGVAGETALYDSLVYALYYFSGIRGRRALLLLSDGEDVRSRYRFEDALELARRTGVTIYTVGIDLPPDAHEARTVLTKLASETGGRSFSVDRTSGLEQVHRVIETELRAQYLLAYQSDATDRDRYREVRVVLDDPRLKARTLAGYYP
jgi:VWFA-related protein